MTVALINKAFKTENRSMVNAVNKAPSDIPPAKASWYRLEVLPLSASVEVVCK